jgi:CRP-like cAMP-binding protein
LLERGLIRGYWIGPDGRQATLAFFHENELVGTAVIMGHPPWAFMQVVVESTVTSLDVETVRDLAASEIEVMTAFATVLAARVRYASRLLSVRSLGNIKERLAYDLLERASRSQLIVGRLEARATQSDLADSIGSSREVVSRALRVLRGAGIVETGQGVIRIEDPVRLAAIVRAFEM